MLPSAEATARHDDVPAISGHFDLERPAVSRLCLRRFSSNSSFPFSILLLLSSHTTPSGGTTFTPSSIFSVESRSFTAASSSSSADVRTFPSKDSEWYVASCDTEVSRLHKNELFVGRGAEIGDKVLALVHSLSSEWSVELSEGTAFEGISESES